MGQRHTLAVVARRSDQNSSWLGSVPPAIANIVALESVNTLIDDERNLSFPQKKCGALLHPRGRAHVRVDQRN
jgi:hypothetical protein